MTIISQIFLYRKDEGEVYVWNMQSRSCSHRFFDDGCVKGTAVNISSDKKFIACGYTIINLKKIAFIYDLIVQI